MRRRRRRRRKGRRKRGGEGREGRDEGGGEEGEGVHVASERHKLQFVFDLTKIMEPKHHF